MTKFGVDWGNDFKDITLSRIHFKSSMVAILFLADSR